MTQVLKGIQSYIEFEVDKAQHIIWAFPTKLFIKLQQHMVINPLPDADYRFILFLTSSCLVCRTER